MLAGVQRVTPPRSNKRRNVADEDTAQDLSTDVQNLGAGLSEENIRAAQELRRKK